MINFYCDMWQKLSEILEPLTALTPKNVKYNWKDEHQKCLDAPFEVHTDASKLQIGAVKSQKGNPIAFYSLKINSSQKSYTTTDK